VLPHAEIDFSRLAPGLPAVVTYAAKWEHGSPEDRGTMPRCPARLPARLASRLTQLAERVWAAVDGTGYGRIDVRVDGRGPTFVTDVNPNPDLGVRAGLARQAAAAGVSYLDLIARIVEDALACTPGQATGSDSSSGARRRLDARRRACHTPSASRRPSAGVSWDEADDLLARVSASR
jgi:D-alanine-D-alanine ligase